MIIGIISFIIGIWIGIILTLHYLRYLERKNQKKISKKHNSFFLDIYKLLDNNSTFSIRVNSLVAIDIHVPSYSGNCILYYDVDSNAISVFSGSDLIELMNNELIDKKLKENLLGKISELYSDDYNDTIKIEGNTFSIKGLDTKYGLSREQIETLSERQKEDVNFDIDAILDKINESGLDSLTDEEKKFLDT